MKAFAAVACLVSFVAASAIVAAPLQTTGAISARKANFKEIGGDFKTMKDEIASGRADMRTVRFAARDLLTRATGQLRFFPRGSGPESGTPTRARAEIWANQAAFLKLQNEMVASARALDAAAQAGDMASLSAAHQALGRTCKSCHDQFRAEQ